MDKQQIFSLLKQGNVTKISIAYFISFFGTAMAPIAMAFGVLELTGSTKDSAIVIAAPITGSIIIMLLGAAIADRTSRKAMIVVADIIAMLAQLIIACLFIFEQANIVNLTILMLINGIAFGLHAPAAMGLIPQLVKKKDLQGTNAIVGIARSSAMILGAAAGGILVATFGAGMTLLIDTGTFALATFLVISLRPSKQIKSQGESIIQELKLGWKEFTSRKWLWVIVVQFCFIVASVEAVYGLIGPAVAKDQMGGAADWGLIAAAIGAGTIVGGIASFYMRFTHPLKVATLTSFSFSFISLALIMPLQLHWIMLAAFLGGIGWEMFSILWTTTLHQAIPSHMLSRVSAYDHIGSIGLAPLGIVVAGFLYESLGFQIVLILCALTVIIPTVLVYCVREVREFEVANLETEENPEASSAQPTN
ncbi:putative transmembrane efflux protein [Marinomonas sp. MED121]|uniref:MFS transporter n=1 Tax=Marinomonas sp. MED121 TaxID=314277 RepID=UPI00006900CA|nr:MFS transporter [Marinomonas sp. MED121]EAQ65788.1 putative transmembrane efflux protein [Marinomonas sp. MED121]